MGCACTKLTAKGREGGGGARDPRRKQQKGDMNLPPVKRTLDRPPTFGQLPDRLTEGNEEEEQKKPANDERSQQQKPQHEQQKPVDGAGDEHTSIAKVLVQRTFEINEFMGYGSRFLTHIVFAIGLFEQKSAVVSSEQPHGEDGEGGDDEDEGVVEFMAQVTKQHSLLLIDEDTASNYSDQELLLAKGAFKVKCSDTETNKQHVFEIKVEVTVDKGGQITPEIIHGHVRELKMHQSVADTIQIVLLQRIETQVKKAAGPQGGGAGGRADGLDHGAIEGGLLSPEDIDFQIELDDGNNLEQQMQATQQQKQNDIYFEISDRGGGGGENGPGAGAAAAPRMIPLQENSPPVQYNSAREHHSQSRKKGGENEKEGQEVIAEDDLEFKLIATDRQARPAMILEDERDAESYYGINPSTHRFSLHSRQSSINSELGQLSQRHLQQQQLTKQQPYEHAYRFDPELINIMCTCEVNEKQLNKQALSANNTVITGLPCALGYDESHQLTCFLRPNLKIQQHTDQQQKNQNSGCSNVGLISNDQFVSIGLALASSPFDNFLQFDKNRIGSFYASPAVRQSERDFPVRYKKPALNAKNYSLRENTRIQGFWLSVKPHVNKVQLLYPNFQPVLLNLPSQWRDQPLKFFVGTRNRSSALLASLDPASFAEYHIGEEPTQNVSQRQPPQRQSATKPVRQPANSQVDGSLSDQEEEEEDDEDRNEKLSGDVSKPSNSEFEPRPQPIFVHQPAPPTNQKPDQPEVKGEKLGATQEVAGEADGFEMPSYYSHVHSSSINMKSHPVDFLQAVNEIPETNFVTNNRQEVVPGGGSGAQQNMMQVRGADQKLLTAARAIDPLTQTQFLVKLAEHNLLDREIHGNMLPYGAFPKNAGYQHGCLDTVRSSTEQSHVQEPDQTYRSMLDNQL